MRPSSTRERTGKLASSARTKLSPSPVLNEYTIQSEAERIDGTSFLCCEANEPFAIRDGRLITGQQQYGSGLTAELVIEALDER